MTTISSHGCLVGGVLGLDPVSVLSSVADGLVGLASVSLAPSVADGLVADGLVGGVVGVVSDLFAP